MAYRRTAAAVEYPKGGNVSRRPTPRKGVLYQSIISSYSLFSLLIKSKTRTYLLGYGPVRLCGKCRRNGRTHEIRPDVYRKYFPAAGLENHAAYPPDHL